MCDPDSVSLLLERATLARLERLVVLARRSPPARRRGAARAGRGIEVGARREYAPGDDVRLVDWPAYARLEKLLVKVVEELPEPRLDLLLDGSGSMGVGVPSPMERASLAAAALAAAATAREVRVTVWWGGEPEARHTLGRPAELVGLLRWLAARTPRGAGRLPEAAARVARSARGRGKAVLLTDGLEPAAGAEAARRLGSAGFDAQLVVVAPSDELQADDAEAGNQAGLVVLVDAETGARREAPFAPVALEAARAARTARRSELLSGLEARGVQAEALLAGAPFEAVARGLLRTSSGRGGR